MVIQQKECGDGNKQDKSLFQSHENWQPFNHRQCWGIDRISTLIQRRNVDCYSTVKFRRCINVEIWLHDVVTNITDL